MIPIRKESKALELGPNSFRDPNMELAHRKGTRRDQTLNRMIAGGGPELNSIQK